MSCLTSPQYTLFLSLVILLTQWSSNFFDGPASLASPFPSSFSSSELALHAPSLSSSGGLSTPHQGAAHRPYSLVLDESNTAYQMVLVGPGGRQEMALTAALQLRRVDAKRDIIIHVTRPLNEAYMEAFEQLRVKVNQVAWSPMVRAEFDYGQCCSMFWACWLKILTWNQTQYRAVLNLDTDFLAVKSMGGLFDIMAANAQTPYDVGGVADPVVATSHKETELFDVFNGGMFMALPSREAYERFLVHAHTTRWQWGEMLWLNTFAKRFGHWVRFPITYNLFPSMLKPNSPYLPYGDVNWDSIYGLHYAGTSKVTTDTSSGDCYSRGDGDCVPCCLMWVAAVERTRALVAANVAAGGEGNEKEKEAMEAYKALLPAGWEGEALAIVKRNRARGATFDWDAWHDGGDGGTWRERVALEAAYVVWMAAGNEGGPPVFEAQYKAMTPAQRAEKYGGGGGGKQAKNWGA